MCIFSDIAPSEDLYHTIRGPASEHPRTCIRTSEDLHRTSKDLHQNILTCIKRSRDLDHTIQTYIGPLRPTAFHSNLSGQQSEPHK